MDERFNKIDGAKQHHRIGDQAMDTDKIHVIGLEIQNPRTIVSLILSTTNCNDPGDKALLCMVSFV